MQQLLINLEAEKLSGWLSEIIGIHHKVLHKGKRWGELDEVKLRLAAVDT